MSPAEKAQVARTTRNAWLLSTPALILLTFAAAGPLLIVLVYSFMLKGQYGNVEWGFSLDGWRGILEVSLVLGGAHEPLRARAASRNGNRHGWRRTASGSASV